MPVRAQAKYAPAEQSLRRSLALQPGSIGALVALGRVLHLLSGTSRRARCWNGRSRWCRASGCALSHLGEVLAGLDQLVLAKHQLRLAIRADPNVAASHNWPCAAAARRPARSGSEFRRAIALDRTLPFGHANLALVLGAQGRVGEAAAAARAAIGGIETTLRDDNLDLLDLIALALDDADETRSRCSRQSWSSRPSHCAPCARSMRHGARGTGSLQRAWRRRHAASANSLLRAAFVPIGSWTPLEAKGMAR